MGTRTGNPTWVDSATVAEAQANPSRKITAAKLNAIEDAIDATPVVTISEDYALTIEGALAVPGGGGGDAAALAQVGTITLPPSPALGQSITVVADDTTSLPGGISWDSGVAPSMATGRRVLGLIWTGEDWIGTYSPVIPLTFATLSEAILYMSPAGYWPLDETSGTTASDSSGNGHHGTYTGTYTLNDRDGAPTFAGGHVSIPDDDVFSIGAAGLTIFAIGYTAVDSEEAQSMVAKGAPDAYEWGMGVNWPARSRSSFAVWWGSGASNYQYEETADAHPKSVWSALAFTVGTPSTQGGRFPLYRDSGVPRATTQFDIAAGAPANGTAPVRIGDRADSWGANWVGSLRHVAIFDKQLTAGQIGILMATARAEGLIP